MIYFVKSGNHVKIGYSDNPKSRISNLKTANPGALSVLGVQDGCKEREKFLHQKFSKYRIGSGEWFSYNIDIMHYIEKNCRPALWGFDETIIIQKSVETIYVKEPPFLEWFVISTTSAVIFTSSPNLDTLFAINVAVSYVAVRVVMLFVKQIRSSPSSG